MNNHVRFNHPTQPLPSMSHEEAMARKRIYNAHYKAMHPHKNRIYRQRVKEKYRAQGRNAHGDPFREPRRRRVEPIVYHAQKETPNNSKIHYCPNCGHGLDKYL